MATFYQLIDLESGNMTSDFSTEDSARDFLQNACNQYGTNVLDSYGLAKMTSLGEIRESFEGQQLKDWVMRERAAASSIVR